MKKKTIEKHTENAEYNEAEYFKKVGERLKYYRKKAGYTHYEQFASKHGFTRPQYGKYEAGANIPFNILLKISHALGVSLEEFFKGFK